jgi:hypothetical protein
MLEKVELKLHTCILGKCYNHIFFWAILQGNPMAMVYTYNLVSPLNPVHGEVYLIQHYEIKFVSD